MSDDPLNSGSDLTDIDEEDDVPLSAQEKARAKASDDSGYMIRGALRVPRATTYTCQALYDQIYAGDIDLQPEYQRDVVWPDNKQIGLIDSIFRNFYVPPVIFVVHIAPDGAERRVCVDGKQRLTSIYRFIGGEIPYKDPFTGERFWFKINSNIKGQILPERYRKMFLNKQIVCMEYQDISPENEREIFQRVQLGMALTPAERLQAISSPATSFIRELLDTYIVGQLADAIEWDTSRANDFRTLAMAVYGMSKWPKLITAPSLATIEKWLHESDELEDKFEADVSNTFQVFCQLAVHPQLSSCFKIQGIKKVAPVEMLAISLLIHANKRRMTLAQLSEAITSMRHDVRLVEKDVRLNSRTMKLLLSFLKKLKPSQLTTANDGQVAASAVRLTGKRKRAVTDSSESDEEEPPSRPAAKSQATAVTKQSTPAQPPPPSLGPPPLPPSQPAPPSQPTPPPPASSATTPLSSGSSTARPASSAAPRPPSGPRGIPTGPSSTRSAIQPPTAPAALRNMTTPSLPPTPSSAPLPPHSASSQQSSLADSLMARMTFGPSPPSTSTTRRGQYSPSMPFHPGPNDFQPNRAYDPSRDPTRSRYQGGENQQPPRPPYGRPS